MSLMPALILAICHGWQDWLGGDKVEPVIEEVPKLEPLVFKCCTDGLELAGKEHYGEKFEFRDGQQFVLNKIYTSSRKLFRVEVHPGYGNPALFQITLLAMKRKCQKKRIVYFILVPYIVLIADMFERLNHGGLVAQYTTNIYRMNDDDITADVYVVCYVSMRDDHLMELFCNWPYGFRNVHLGHLRSTSYAMLDTRITAQRSPMRSAIWIPRILRRLRCFLESLGRVALVYISKRLGYLTSQQSKWRTLTR